MDRRQTTDITGRRQNQERRKDAETREKYDVLSQLVSDGQLLYENFGLDIDQFPYRTALRRLIEDAAKKIRVIQEKESHENASV